MNAIEEAVSGDSAKGAKGPGERLQAARIQQGLTLEDVANRMHLSTGILEALEENNFEEITAPIFVKGYLRAYARIVSLDEEEMIGLYTEYHRDDDPPIATINNVGSELSVSDARIRWTTYLVVLMLLTLLAAWWWNRQNTEATPISLDSQVEETTLAESAAPEPRIEATSATVEPGPAPLPPPSGAAAVNGGDDAAAAAPIAEDAAEAVTAVAPAPREPAPADAAVAAPAADAAAGIVLAEAPRDAPDTLAGEQESPAPAAAPEPAGDAVATTTAIPATGDRTRAADRAAAADTGVDPGRGASAAASRLPTVAAPSGSARLELVVHADTWADIKDGSGFRLVYDLLRAGSSIELTGEAPFAVFLGNGHGVELRYDGAAVDFSADIRDNNTARLSIGE